MQVTIVGHHCDPGLWSHINDVNHFVIPVGPAKDMGTAIIILHGLYELIPETGVTQAIQHDYLLLYTITGHFSPTTSSRNSFLHLFIHHFWCQGTLNPQLRPKVRRKLRSHSRYVFGWNSFTNRWSLGSVTVVPGDLDGVADMSMNRIDYYHIEY